VNKAALLLAPSLLLLMSSTLPAELPKQYEQFSRKSIFAKDRVARSNYTRSTTAPAAVQVSASPILIGIIDDESGYIAVLETPGAGILTPLHVGDTLPGNVGLITDMTLDYIDIAVVDAPHPEPTSRPTTLPAIELATMPATSPTTRRADDVAHTPTPSPSFGPATRRIVIGHNLEGTQAATYSSYSASSSSSSASTAPIEGDDIVSRMRRRRQQEGAK
jgi:hypothetical protein